MAGGCLSISREGPSVSDTLSGIGGNAECMTGISGSTDTGRCGCTIVNDTNESVSESLSEPSSSGVRGCSGCEVGAAGGSKDSLIVCDPAMSVMMWVNELGGGGIGGSGDSLPGSVTDSAGETSWISLDLRCDIGRGDTGGLNDGL